jgi:hypothetical protein
MNTSLDIPPKEGSADQDRGGHSLRGGLRHHWVAQVPGPPLARLRTQCSTAHTVFNVPFSRVRCAHESHRAAVHRGAGLLTRKTGMRSTHPRDTLLTQRGWDETEHPGPTGLDTFNGSCADMRSRHGIMLR